MAGKDGWGWGGSPPALFNTQKEKGWGPVNDSVPVDAVSFGFVATAILIFMFLVMAVYERFLRPRSLPVTARTQPDPELRFCRRKLHFQSPTMAVYGRGVSPVLMPGEEFPTFLARPAPAPCPPDRALKLPRPNNMCLSSSS